MSDLDKAAAELRSLILRDSVWGTADPEERARIALDAEIEGDLMTGLTSPRDMINITKLDIEPIQGDYRTYDDGTSARNRRTRRKTNNKAK